MPSQKRLTLSQISKFILLTIGIVLVMASAFVVSSFLTILGTAIIFWGAILFYITPVKHVPLTLVELSANSNTPNIERILSEFDSSERGIYLPPKNLKNIESSLIFVPKTLNASLPLAEEITEKLYHEPGEGMFLTPPGLGLSQLFEKELNMSFTKTNLKQLELVLPKILIEDLELAENVEIEFKENIVMIKITDSIFNGVCEQTNSQPHAHAQVGCLMASALACVLAKATGKPITIQNETTNQETKTTHIEYQIFEGKTMQLPRLNFSDARLNDGEVKSSMSGDSDLNILGIEIAPNALNYLAKNGDVVILTATENQQNSSYKIKGYDADAKLVINFLEFVEVCKTYHDSQTNINNQSEFTTKIFDAMSPTILKHYDLAFYVAKSGFSTVHDWLKTLKDYDEIPEGSTRHSKIFYLYHIQRRATN